MQEDGKELGKAVFLWENTQSIFFTLSPLRSWKVDEIGPVGCV